MRLHVWKAWVSLLVQAMPLVQDGRERRAGPEGICRGIGEPREQQVLHCDGQEQSLHDVVHSVGACGSGCWMMSRVHRLQNGAEQRVVNAHSQLHRGWGRGGGTSWCRAARCGGGE